MMADSRVNFLLLLITVSDASETSVYAYKQKYIQVKNVIFISLHRADYGFASIICMPVCLAVSEITQK